MKKTKKSVFTKVKKVFKSVKKLFKKLQPHEMLVGSILIVVALLGSIRSAHADGTGTFVSNDGYVMTNRHVVEDYIHNPNIKFLVWYHGRAVPAEVVSIGVPYDLALLKIKAETPCLRVAQQDIVLNRVLTLLTFNFLDGQYTDIQNRKVMFDIHPLSFQTILQQDAFEVEPVIRPGDSGSPILNANKDIVAVAFAGETMTIAGMAAYTAGYALTNETLMAFKEANSKEITCYFPNRDHLKDNIVWVVELVPPNPMAELVAALNPATN